MCVFLQLMGVSCMQSKLPGVNAQSKMPLDTKSENSITAARFVTLVGQQLFAQHGISGIISTKCN